MISSALVLAKTVERLQEDSATHPEQTVRSTAVCRFRTLARSKMMGYRLEANARVTPGNRWVVFQSSSEDGWFKVWAAGAGTWITRP